MKKKFKPGDWVVCTVVNKDHWMERDNIRLGEQFEVKEVSKYGDSIRLKGCRFWHSVLEFSRALSPDQIRSRPKTIQVNQKTLHLKPADDNHLDVWTTDGEHVGRLTAHEAYLLTNPSELLLDG